MALPPALIALALASLVLAAAFLGLAAWHGFHCERHRCQTGDRTGDQP